MWARQGVSSGFVSLSAPLAARARWALPGCCCALCLIAAALTLRLAAAKTHAPAFGERGRVVRALRAAPGYTTLRARGRRIPAEQICR
jgi:hypothetical protein